MDAKFVRRTEQIVGTTCVYWLAGRCNKNPCRFLHKKTPSLHARKDFDRSKKDVLPRRLEPQLDPLQRLWMVAKRIRDEPAQLELDADVVGSNSTIPLYIFQKDVLEVCRGGDMLCISIIQLWLMYLHRLCMENGTAHLYGFIDPLRIQSIGNKPAESQAYLQRRLFEGQKKCYLAPYYCQSHWQLLVLCPMENIVVFFCSLGNKQSKNIQMIVDLAMEEGHKLAGRHLSQIKKPTWIYPYSQRQRGSYECGYYVMKHMFTIVSANVLDSWELLFNNEESFTKDEIKDIREHWADFFLELSNL